MDYIKFCNEYKTMKQWDDDILKLDLDVGWPPMAERAGIEGATGNDMVNHPAHYTKGKYEAIDIIEDAIEDAPTPTLGMLQGQVLKYILRLWFKGHSKQDAEKARWYLDRLIEKL